jgi:serine/threonine protein kinase
LSGENAKNKCPRCGGNTAIVDLSLDIPCACASTPKEWIRRTLTREMEREIPVDKDEFPLRRYKPLSLIGSGANGSVYCCRDRLLRKTVAIKVISDATSSHLVAFQKEAKATSKLVHPNIIAVLDFGVEGGTPYMVMELFEGISLAQAIQNEKCLNIMTAISVFSRVCDGLAEAHRLGVFHRDIKCSNILVSDLDSESPAVRIIDFGVAKVRQEQDAGMRTQGLTLVGTPQYMSPDQASGKPFSARSEIYSVGCALFEALTGEPPYSGESAMEIINQHATAPVPTLSEKNPRTFFPRELEDLISSCLAKDPERRPESMLVLGDALNNLSINMTLSNPTIKLEMAPKRKKNKQKSIVLMSVSALFLLSMLFVSATLLQPQRDSIPRKVAVRKVASVATRGPRWHMDKVTTITTDDTDAIAAYETATDDDLTYVAHSKTSALSLKGSQITNKGLAQLTELPLKYLSLEDMHSIDDSSSPLIAKFTGLKQLILSGTKITNDGIAGLAGLKSLERLDVSGLDITDSGMELIVAQWPKIRDLDLSSTLLTDKGMTKLKNLRDLRALTLSNAEYGDAVMEKIIGHPTIEYLGFYRVKFAPKFLEQFPKMSNLRSLSFFGRLPGVDAAEYTKLEAKLDKRCRFRLLEEGNSSSAVQSVEPVVELMGE